VLEPGVVEEIVDEMAQRTGLAADTPGELATAFLRERLPVLGEEIADTVSFLAGERAAYVTGTTLSMNGGQYLVG